MKFKKSFLFISMLLCIPYLGAMEDSDKSSKEELNVKTFIACQEGDIEKMTDLIKQGADVNYDFTNLTGGDRFANLKKSGYFADNYDYHDICRFHTLLHYAIRNSTAAIVKFLIDNGADIYKKTGEGNSMFYVAAAFNEIKCLNLLCKKAKDDNIKPVSEYLANQNLIYFSLANANKPAKSRECLKILLGYGADVNAIDRDGYTALNFLVSKSRFSSQTYIVPCLKFLLEQGANVNAKEKYCDIPLLEVLNSFYPNMEVVYWLLYFTKDKDKSTLKKAFNKTCNFEIKQLIKCHYLFDKNKFCRFAFIKAVSDEWINGRLIKHFLIEKEMLFRS